MKRPRKLVLAALFGLGAAEGYSAPTNIVPQGTGGVLTWQTAVAFTDLPEQVNTEGTHHAAVRFGNTDLVVNGVTFSRHLGGGTFANNSPITTTPATVASLGSGGSGNYGALVSTGGFQNTGNSPQVTLGGLTPGRRYQVQLFAPYWDMLWQTYFGVAGGPSAMLWTGVAGKLPASVCIGNFRATGTSQSIIWAGDQPGSFAFLAAVSVRLLPDETTMEIAENNAAGATVDTLVAADDTAGSSHTLSLVSGAGSADNASFTLEGSKLKILSPADFETKSSYSIRVQADDGSGGVFSKAFTVKVLDVPEPPEIVVEQPAGTDLTSGSASIDFGPVTLGTAGMEKVFTIRNTGLSNLTLVNPSVIGGQASDFTVNSAAMLLSVPPNGQTTFSVTFTPGGSGTRSSTLSIGSNDSNESPFTIALTGTGTGTLPSAPELSVELGGTDLTSEVTAWGLNTSGQTSVPAGLKDVIAVAAGHEHTLALRKNGTVVAWGSNAHGQCDVPAGMFPVKMIAAGKWHSLALMTNGQVVMWGDDHGGAFAMPAGLSGVTAIAAGGLHSLALRDDGTVTAWGDNSEGQIHVPAGLSGVTAIAAGERHSLALRGSDQKVFAWGDNNANQTSVPTLLTLTSFIDASGGASYAISSGGQVTAWGDNSQGQTTLPGGLSSISHIDGGLGHALAKKSDGTLVAWGSDAKGQTTLPSAIGTMTRIASGADHNVTVGIARPIAFGSLARGIASTPKTITLRNTGTTVLTIGTVKVTGDDAADFSVDLTGMAGSVPAGGSTRFTVSCTASVLGDRTTKLLIVNSDSDEYFTQIPLTATGVPQPPSLVNAMHAYLTAHTVKLGANVINDGEAAITGRGVVLSMTAANSNPKIGDPGVIQLPVTGTLGAFWEQVENLTASTSYTFRVYATNSAGTGYTPARSFTTPAAKGRIEMRSTDGLIHGGTVLVWGGNTFGMRQNVPTDTDIIAITAGVGHGVVLRRDGTVYAWGDNSWAGQTAVPAGLSDVIAIAAGDYFTLALKSDGTVVSWGKDTTTGLKPPDGLSGVIAIAAGNQHALALKNDGTVVQWPPATDMPEHLSGIVGIAAGEGHSVAVRGDGTVTGWGANYLGQINFPAALTDVVAVAARDATSVVLQSNGNIGAWGGNIGIPSGVPNVAGLGTGDMANMAYTRGGTFIGWGDNSDGKLTPPPGLSHVIGIAGGSYATAVMRRELPFGSVNVSASRSIQFAIRNRGDGLLNISQMNVIGDHAGDFTVSKIAGPDAPAPEQDVVMEVTFSPVAGGNREAVLRIQTDDPVSPNFDILLTGTALAQLPTISDPTITSLSHHSAVLGARVTKDGGSPVTRRGVVLSLTTRNTNPTLGDVGVMMLPTEGTLGVFTVPAAGLLMNREYAMRGFATNAVGTSYTDVVTFTTSQVAMPEIQVEQPVGTLVSSPVVGRGHVGETPPLPGVVSMAAGHSFAMALTQDGRVIVWGDNSVGQLNFPEEMSDVVAVSAGNQHALALNRHGAVFATGFNFNLPNNVPASVGNDVTAIHAAWLHNMVLHRDGTVTCWPGGLYVSGDQSWVTPPAGLTNVVAITGGYGFSAALKDDGTLVTWGMEVALSVLSPPEDLFDVRAIAAGSAHMLALRNDGIVVAWGDTPPVPEGLDDVVAIFAGQDYNLARRSDGSVVAWGSGEQSHLQIPADHAGYQFVTGGYRSTYTVDSMIDFGQVQLGTETSRTFTIRNTGDATLNISSITIVGVSAPDFSVTSPDSTTLAPGASTTVTVTFNPGALWSRRAVLRILSDDHDEGTLDISLKGSGLSGPPTVITQISNNITKTSTTFGGIVIHDGSSPIYDRGIVFSAAAENNDPYFLGIGVTKISVTGTLGPFSVDVTNLAPGTSYVFKAFAANGQGVSYSNPVTITTLPGPRVAVGNLVFWDKNANGHADTGEGIDGVTVQLFTSTQDPLTDTPLRTTTTANGGIWLIDQLNEGSYRVFIPASMFASGQPLDHFRSMTGVLPSGDDDIGEKGQDSLTPDTLGVRTDVFNLTEGTLPAGDQELGQQGGSDDARDASVDLTQDFGFVDVIDLPATFARWKQQHGITGQGNGNHDFDARDDLLEYALGLTSTNEAAQFRVDAQSQSGQTHIVLRRRHGSQADLVFKVQLCPDLSGAQGGWSATTITPVITNNGDGTETLTFPNVITDPALNGSAFGFTRLLIELDADHNGTPELTTSSDILGWQHRPLGTRTQTYGLAFVRPAVFTAIVDGIQGATLDVTTAAGTTDLRTFFTVLEHYYVEVIAGDHEGHRYEVDEANCTATTIALLLNDRLSTQASLDTNLSADSIALRPHWRVKDLFPPGSYTAGTSAANSDQLQLWDPALGQFTPLLLGQFIPPHLVTNPSFGRMWVPVGTSTNQNERVIGPADGLFIKPRQDVIAAANGQVRTWKFACPLRAGINLIGNPYPVAQSFSSRLMTTVNGFTGAISASSADRVNAWSADASGSIPPGYVPYMLAPTGAWVKVGEIPVVNRSSDAVFTPGTASFITSRAGHPFWIMPAAVAP